ncbi:MAG: NAD(P)H-hydrate dehydratase [Bacteroidales bacterium]|nr:NAD(P)H-hydrate dehydratase [Bacteroidales bacterium]MDZ4203732.1 NAD(P)H-hydrate dehydratase [Bacteroidales bacterium]
MIKILPVEKIREADAYTIANEPIASIDLMERAAGQCFKWLIKKNPLGKSIKIFCGTGNNGGDGLVLARLLLNEGHHVEVFILRYGKTSSDDFLVNYQRMKELPHAMMHDINVKNDIPAFSPDDLLVDAIFGSGLTKPAEGLVAETIEAINLSRAIVIAIDLPSGLFADTLRDAKKGAVIHADYTLTFQFPKLSFFFPESDAFVGEWHVLPIGLHQGFVAGAPSDRYLIEAEDVQNILKPRQRFAHKGNYGHALLVAGSYGKMGAAVLASRACLRAGAGLLTTHVPRSGYEIIQTAFPEAMVSVDESDSCFSGIKEPGLFEAIAIGPGLGLSEETATALKTMIQTVRKPFILDADAINILGENKTWLSFLPPGCILTPHPREFERIASKINNSLDRNEMQRLFSIKYGVYVVLKGAFTCISTPQGNCYFNPTGNPGMATAGSGDVLTGILLGLLAQGYSLFETCVLGTFLHGLAGDYAMKHKSAEAMIASDIIDYLGRAFRNFYKK